jgi:CDP-glycerol glycerophosphotransferase
MSVQYINEGKKLKYFVSPSAYASEKFISAFRLRDANKADAMLETGYPRNDLLFNYDEAMIAGIREKLGIDPDDQRKIILYAPTWRDDQYDPVTGYTYNLNVDFDQMKADMDDEYIIIFRVHYFISNSFDFERFGDFIIDASEYDDINHLYIVSDLLITDYSSVFFDYANLKRPMLFYMYDLAFYEEKARGFYFDIREELPGQIVEREEALIPAIRTALSSFVYNDQYKAFNAKYNYLDDGEATKRLLDIVCHPLDSAY